MRSGRVGRLVEGRAPAVGVARCGSWCRLVRFEVGREGRHVRPAEARGWTPRFFVRLGLHRPCGTVRDPGVVPASVCVPAGQPGAGNPHARLERGSDRNRRRHASSERKVPTIAAGAAPGTTRAHAANHGRHAHGLMVLAAREVRAMRFTACPSTAPPGGRRRARRTGSACGGWGSRRRLRASRRRPRRIRCGRTRCSGFARSAIRPRWPPPDRGGRVTG